MDIVHLSRQERSQGRKSSPPPPPSIVFRIVLVKKLETGEILRGGREASSDMFLNQNIGIIICTCVSCYKMLQKSGLSWTN